MFAAVVVAVVVAVAAVVVAVVVVAALREGPELQVPQRGQVVPEGNKGLH